MDSGKLKRELVRMAKLLYHRRLVQAAGGNISVRLPDSDRFLITSSGVSLRDVTAEDLIIVDIEGNEIEGKSHCKPSKETGLHTAIYKNRPEVNVVFHTHPTFVTTFAVMKRIFPLVTASASLKLKKVCLVKYAPPGSRELANFVAEAVRKANFSVKVLVLERHGMITLGENMVEVFNNTELAEETAKIALLSSLNKKGR